MRNFFKRIMGKNRCNSIDKISDKELKDIERSRLKSEIEWDNVESAKKYMLAKKCPRKNWENCSEECVNFADAYVTTEFKTENIVVTYARCRLWDIVQGK